MKRLYGYIRVSTIKQGDGVSLEVQEEDIIRYAKRKNLKIIAWFKEKKSASKGFRPQFNQMMDNLYNKKADGFIAHKIDRMMRNRNDWATINDLMDIGREVYSADGTTMDDVNGRFMGDIQAAVATRYSSNLSQEAKKGLYGRLKQGIFPFKAPIGYVDKGKGQVKTIDPIQSELVKQAFQLYMSGEYSVLELSKEMEKRGLKNTKGKRLCKNGIIRLLKNPFYTGIMKIKGKTYKGKHKALIDTRLFKQVQMVFKSRNRGKITKHNYLFRKLIRCEQCSLVMSGERQKGRVYYRCKTKNCLTKTIREDTAEYYVKNVLKTVSLTKKEASILNEIITEEKANSLEIQETLMKGYSLQAKQYESKEQKLLDAYLDDMVEKDEYEKRKQKILFKQRELEERKESIANSIDAIFNRIDDLVELCKSPLKTYNSGIKEEKREILETITSNLTICGRKAMFSMVSPFRELANRDLLSFGGHDRDTNRTLPRKYIYSDINTSPIIPKPLNRQQLKDFFQFLLIKTQTLSIPNNLKTDYEIQTDNPSAQ